MTSIGHSKKYIKVDHLNEEQQSILKNKRVKIDRLTSDINHLSKTLLQTEDASTWPKHVSPNTLSIFPDEKSWNSIKSVNINSDKHAFKDMSGLTWNTMKESMHLDSDVEDSYSEGSSPSTTRLDMNDMKIYGAMPMEDEIVVVKCKHCHKPVLANQFRVHLDQCKEAIGIEPEENDKSKQRSSYSDDEESVKKEPKTEDMAGKTLPVPIEKDDKKKAKKDIKEVREVKKKSMKQKAPLDLDKQCGVIQGPNNLPCTRSLTCKSHSMGLKRAVEGRSQAYDILLAAYQKKAIGRPNGKEIVKKKGKVLEAYGMNI
ncbi:SCA7, zinc-binding domain-containing protein [Pilobolus umbonatus]|nr:SCA7, zinc-binding domain-containing protein [Pilobolus umbonatus]